MAYVPQSPPQSATRRRPMVAPDAPRAIRTYSRRERERRERLTRAHALLDEQAVTSGVDERGRAQEHADALLASIARAHALLDEYASADGAVEEGPLPLQFSSDESYDDDVAVRPDVHFSVIADAASDDARPVRAPRFVSPYIVPLQSYNPTDACGGTWCQVAPGVWQLVDDLSEAALLGVQMLLSEPRQERRPDVAPAGVRRNFSHGTLPSAGAATASDQPQQQQPRLLGMCVVCLDQHVGAAFRNCGHVCICTGCRTRLVERSRTGGWIRCPVCRVDGTTLEVFL